MFVCAHWPYFLLENCYRLLKDVFLFSSTIFKYYLTLFFMDLFFYSWFFFYYYFLFYNNCDTSGTLENYFGPNESFICSKGPSDRDTERDRERERDE